MANDCDYQMKVVGEKEKIEEFIKVMQCYYDYGEMKFDYDRHMGGRIFEAYLDNEKEREDGLYEAYISGNCAWSVSCCMFDGEYSYYNFFKEEYKEKCRSTTIPIESKNLNLDIEIYSEEYGFNFQEHYLVRKGETEINEVVNYSEYYVGDYRSKEEAEKDLKIEISDDEWESTDRCLTIGGFGDWDFII